ncbi:MAG: hypothetical protein GX458_08545 [Phyllobacteriaceae bacterium]|nr:hypothetical protein [Phyllobacteriaceae bacterium]
MAASIAGSEAAESDPVTSVRERFLVPFCSGHCAVTVFAGPQLTTDLAAALGAEGKFTAPWDYRWGASKFIGGALSRDVFEYRDYFKIEAEIGVGQRFGSFHETDGWGALYFRWTKFPWNDWVKTSIAASTGLDFASAVPAWEARETGVPGGSKLMHYFSPEITFAAPSNPDWEIVLRIHHRSGGRKYWGDVGLFNGTGGGIQYGVIGIRHHF